MDFFEVDPDKPGGWDTTDKPLQPQEALKWNAIADFNPFRNSFSNCLELIPMASPRRHNGLRPINSVSACNFPRQVSYHPTLRGQSHAFRGGFHEEEASKF